MSQARFLDGWPDPNTCVTPGNMWSNCAGGSWDAQHEVSIVRKPWTGWMPVKHSVTQYGVRSLPGISIPEDALHAPLTYPLWDDPPTYNCPGGARSDPERVRSHLMDVRGATMKGIRQGD
eukprot:8693337-Pyramimonas_sp.AAC.2